METCTSTVWQQKTDYHTRLSVNVMCYVWPKKNCGFFCEYLGGKQSKYYLWFNSCNIWMYSNHVGPINCQGDPNDKELLNWTGQVEGDMHVQFCWINSEEKAVVSKVMFVLFPRMWPECSWLLILINEWGSSSRAKRNDSSKVGQKALKLSHYPA